jgi:SAM-dependent methyltransferase
MILQERSETMTKTTGGTNPSTSLSAWVYERIRRIPSAPKYYLGKLFKSKQPGLSTVPSNTSPTASQEFAAAVGAGQSDEAIAAFSRNSAEYRQQYWNRLAQLNYQHAIAGCSGVSEAAFLESGRDILNWLHEYQLCDDTSFVLDIGCGAGRIAYHVAPLVKFLYGIDVSDEMLSRARGNLQHLVNVELRRTTGETLAGFPDQSIDFVYSILVLQHMERSNCYRMFDEVARVLRPSGKFLVQLPWSGSPLYTSAYTAEPRDNDLWYARVYSEDELHRLFSENKLVADLIQVKGDNLWGIGNRAE